MLYGVANSFLEDAEELLDRVGDRLHSVWGYYGVDVNGVGRRKNCIEQKDGGFLAILCDEIVGA